MILLHRMIISLGSPYFDFRKACLYDAKSLLNQACVAGNGLFPVPHAMAAAAADDPKAIPDARLSRDGEGRNWVELSGVWNLRALEPVLPLLEEKLAQFKTAAGWDLSGEWTAENVRGGKP